jgi:hypothetical protein
MAGRQPTIPKSSLEVVTVRIKYDFESLQAHGRHRTLTSKDLGQTLSQILPGNRQWLADEVW